MLTINKKYMKAIGIDVPDNAGMAMITGMYKDQMATLEKEVQKLDGFPIVNDMKLTMTKNAMPQAEEEEKEKKITLKDVQNDFGGLLGKKIMKDAKKNKKKEEKPKNLTIIHINSEISEVSSESISDTKFEPKKGYKLKK